MPQRALHERAYDGEHAVNTFRCATISYELTTNIPDTCTYKENDDRIQIEALASWGARQRLTTVRRRKRSNGGQAVSWRRPGF
jgi:hypothetical protein